MNYFILSQPFSLDSQGYQKTVDDSVFYENTDSINWREKMVSQMYKEVLYDE